ncbi:MAG TPA: hypothetical protein VNO87_11735 [Methylomirabilota bacterium]|nr:hypothetical protein [Methylomirabilota bacterium]
MIADHDDVLTDPVRGWTWSFGMDDEPAEPSSVLLPGRVDAPSSSRDGSSAVGQFRSESAAATAADALAGICVSETVILPGQPYPWGDEADQDTLRAVTGQLIAAGAHDAFITDADTGYLHSIDIRAHCDDRDLALAIGRRMVPMSPPFHEGLIKAWAPGRKLTEDQVRARMYVASLERSDRPPRDELESKIWAIWRAWREDQLRAANQHVADPTGLHVSAVGDIRAAMQKHKVALDVFLGTEAEEWGSPWYLHWQAVIENNDLCLSSVWCMHIATGFPALVRWLHESGVKSATYSVYNRMRP